MRAQFYSTVRIVCMSPPNDNLNACLPILVSLNGVDWVNTETCFGYYTNPEITNMFLGSTANFDEYQNTLFQIWQATHFLFKETWQAKDKYLIPLTPLDN